MRKKYLKRKYQLRKKKPFYKRKFFWLGILFSIILGGTFYLLFFSPIFQIKEIEIAGTEKTSPEEIQTITQEQVKRSFLLFSSKSIFLVPAKKIRTTLLEKFVEIRAVNLKRHFPDRLVIKIEERRPEAIFCHHEPAVGVFSAPSSTSTPPAPAPEQRPLECFFIDKEGIIFEKLPQENKSGYLIINNDRPDLTLGLGGQAIGKENLDRSLEIKKGLKENFNIALKNIFQANEEKLIAKTIGGWEIYFNLKEDIKTQLENMGLILEKEISPEKRADLEYIDLRFGSKVYYKFK